MMSMFFKGDYTIEETDKDIIVNAMPHVTINEDTCYASEGVIYYPSSRCFHFDKKVFGWKEDGTHYNVEEHWYYKKLFYLAHPYEAETQSGVGWNVTKANGLAAFLISRGLTIYSPISMTHGIHLEGVSSGYWDATEHEIWMEQDKIIANRCHGIILAPGWKDSKGCQRELLWFNKWRKEIYYYEDVLKRLG